MKTLKIIAGTFLLTIFLGHTSLAIPADTPDELLRATVTKMLTKSGESISTDEKVRITFFITNDDELVVLKTDAQDRNLDRYIKSSLNYKLIKIKDLDRNRIVHIKVHFQPK